MYSVPFNVTTSRRKILRATAAALAALSLATSCSLTSDLAEPDKPVFTSIAQTESEESESPTTESEVDKTTEAETTTGGSKEGEFTEVDPARFSPDGTDTHHVVGLAGTGSLGCKVTDSEHWDRPNLLCAVDYAGEVPDSPYNLNVKPNVMNYESVHGFYSFHQFEANELAPPSELAPGEQVTTSGFTFTRLDEDTVRIQRGANTATISAGEVTVASPADTILDRKPDIEKSTDAGEGALCGTVTDFFDETAGVIALESGTDCPAAAKIAEEYFDPDTPKEGSGGFWTTAPDGWTCGRGYLAPGMEDAGANKRPVCSAEGKGSVAIVNTTEQ